MFRILTMLLVVFCGYSHAVIKGKIYEVSATEAAIKAGMDTSMIAITTDSIAHHFNTLMLRDKFGTFYYMLADSHDAYIPRLYADSLLGGLAGVVDSAADAAKLNGYAGTSYNRLDRIDNHTANDTFSIIYFGNSIRSTSDTSARSIRFCGTNSLIQYNGGTDTMLSVKSIKLFLGVIDPASNLIKINKDSLYIQLAAGETLMVKTAGGTAARFKVDTTHSYLKGTADSSVATGRLTGPATITTFFTFAPAQDIVSGGTLYVSNSITLAVPEGGAALDTITTIVGAAGYTTLMLKTADASKDIFVNDFDGAGNVYLSADWLFGDTADMLFLIYYPGNGWLEVSRSDN